MFYTGNPLTSRIDWTPIQISGSTFPFLLSVTVYQNGSRDGETRHSELIQAAEVLWRVGHDVLTSNALSGTVTDRNGAVTGKWTYTPTAPS